MIKLVGMMDSPYVRRVAISLELYGVEFESQPLSVFSTSKRSPESTPR
jgi:glutathione S-transferase